MTVLHAISLPMRLTFQHNASTQPELTTHNVQPCCYCVADLPYQAVHSGNKVTPSHPEYGLDQAPMHYIEPYLNVETVRDTACWPDNPATLIHL